MGVTHVPAPGATHVPAPHTLGDPVYHAKEKVGTVTSIVWNRARGSLDIEFDPEPLQRISVGEIVWVAIDGSATAKNAR